MTGFEEARAWRGLPRLRMDSPLEEGGFSVMQRHMHSRPINPYTLLREGAPQIYIRIPFLTKPIAVRPSPLITITSIYSLITFTLVSFLKSHLFIYLYLSMILLFILWVGIRNEGIAKKFMYWVLPPLIIAYLVLYSINRQVTAIVVQVFGVGLFLSLVWYFGAYFFREIRVERDRPLITILLATAGAVFSITSLCLTLFMHYLKSVGEYSIYFSIVTRFAPYTTWYRAITFVFVIISGISVGVRAWKDLIQDNAYISDQERLSVQQESLSDSIRARYELLVLTVSGYKDKLWKSGKILWGKLIEFWVHVINIIVLPGASSVLIALSVSICTVHLHQYLVVEVLWSEESFQLMGFWFIGLVLLSVTGVLVVEQLIKANGGQPLGKNFLKKFIDGMISWIPGFFLVYCSVGLCLVVLFRLILDLEFLSYRLWGPVTLILGVSFGILIFRDRGKSILFGIRGFLQRRRQQRSGQGV